MSLTRADLEGIRTVVREEVRDEVGQQATEIKSAFLSEIRGEVQVQSDEIRTTLRNELREDIRYEIARVIDPITGEIKALRNDVKGIYSMISELQIAVFIDTK